MAEEINHPSHYGGDVWHEPIKIIDAWGLGFCLGNALKYIRRADLRDTPIKDLQKARWYLDWEIRKREQAERGTQLDIDWDAAERAAKADNGHGSERSVSGAREDAGQ